MPMQPSPIAETHGPPRPSLRCFIEQNLAEETEGNEGLTEGGSSPSYLRYLCCLLWSSSNLSDPGPGRAFFPACTDRIKFALPKRSRFKQSRVLAPAFRFLCANNRGVNARHAESESQRGRDAPARLAA